MEVHPFFTLDACLAIAFSAASFLVHSYNIEDPPGIVFDELHFVSFAGYYLNREYFFDIHPPLGKLIYALVIKVSEYFFNTNPDSLVYSVSRTIGTNYESHVPYVALRLCSCFFSSMIIGLVFLIVRKLGFTLRMALFTSLVMLTDMHYVAHQRLVTLDSIENFFIFLAVYLFLNNATSFKQLVGLSHDQPRISYENGDCVYIEDGLEILDKVRQMDEDASNKPPSEFKYTYAYLTELTQLGIAIGCVVSVKLVGLFVVFFLAVMYVLQFLAIFRSTSRPLLEAGKAFMARFVFLVILPLVIFVSLFIVHVAILDRHGPGSKMVSMDYAYSLKGTSDTLHRNMRMPGILTYGSIFNIKTSNSQNPSDECYLRMQSIRYVEKYMSNDTEKISSNGFRVVCDTNYSYSEEDDYMPHEKKPDLENLTPHDIYVQFPEYNKFMVLPTGLDETDIIAYALIHLPNDSEQHAQYKARHVNSDNEESINDAITKFTATLFTNPNEKTIDSYNPQMVKLDVPIELYAYQVHALLQTSDVATFSNIFDQEVSGLDFKSDNIRETEFKFTFKYITNEYSAAYDDAIIAFHTRVSIDHIITKSRLAVNDFYYYNNENRQEVVSTKRDTKISTFHFVDHTHAYLHSVKLINAKKLNLFQKIKEELQLIFFHTTSIKLGHPFGSFARDWPLLKRGVLYYVNPENNSKIYFIGNPFEWIITHFGGLLFIALVIIRFLRQSRLINDFTPIQNTIISNMCLIVAPLYLVHYFPYFMMDRVLFFHHYIPSKLFMGVLGSGTIGLLAELVEEKWIARSANNCQSKKDHLEATDNEEETNNDASTSIIIAEIVGVDRELNHDGNTDILRPLMLNSGTIIMAIILSFLFIGVLLYGPLAFNLKHNPNVLEFIRLRSSWDYIGFIES